MPLRYLDNSPIFYAGAHPRRRCCCCITTPMTRCRGTRGSSSFSRSGGWARKPTCLPYNGEPHHLRRRPNQKDYAARMAQFFDFELKGAPQAGLDGEGRSVPAYAGAVSKRSRPRTLRRELPHPAEIVRLSAEPSFTRCSAAQSASRGHCSSHCRPAGCRSRSA